MAYPRSLRRSLAVFVAAVSFPLSTSGLVAHAAVVPSDAPGGPGEIGGSDGSHNGPEIARSARDRFRGEHPGTEFHMLPGDRIGRVYGKSFSSGVSPIDSAERFRLDHAAIFGIDPQDLVLEGPFEDRRAVQPILWDEAAGDYRFFGVYYTQTLGGLPVHTGVLKMLVRNEPGFPLVLVAADVRPVDAATELDALTALPPRALDPARFAARAFDQFRAPPAMSAVESVVFAGTDDDLSAPRVAIRFELEGGTVFDPTNYRRFRYIADADTGEILLQESLVLHQSVEGVVEGLATEGIAADLCDDESATPMPYARVVAGSSTIFADAEGLFSVNLGAGDSVVLNSEVRGQYFNVNNSSGSDGQVSASGTAGEFVTLLHNADNGSEQRRAEVNAYLHSNIVRDFALAQNPAYPTIANQTNFTVNVNIADNCNAFYNGSSINFYTSGGGCSNTANTTVVYHEYGHHLINVGGSGQGAFGEGMSDTVAVAITDSPSLGLGFQNNCNTPLRSADNSVQYPCTTPIHSCGRVLSGSVWDTREALVAAGVENYRELIAGWVINSILMHTGTSITPQITIDFLSLDDDDDDILNGTPHYAQIDEGFGLHNMPAPEVSLLDIGFPEGLPSLSDPSIGVSFPVEVLPLSATPSGTVRLGWRTEGQTDFILETCPPLGENTYLATIPAAPCGTEIQYYILATTDEGALVYAPVDGSAAPETVVSATSLIQIFDDDGETDPGWVVINSSGLADGAWVRGVPAGGGDRGDPPADGDGSGRCWLTDNADGNSDVDDGSTSLVSPVIDATGGEAYVCYLRWFSNTEGASPNQDVFVVSISNDGGGSWTTLETVGPGGPEVDGGWFEACHRIADFVEPTAEIRLRFTAEDAAPGSIVEAGVDAVRIETVQCDPSNPADLDGDGTVNGADLAILLGAWGTPGPGDLDGNGTVNGADLAILLGAWGDPIP